MMLNAKKKLTCSKISLWYFSQLEREDYNNCRKKDEKGAKKKWSLIMNIKIQKAL